MRRGIRPDNRMTSTTAQSTANLTREQAIDLIRRLKSGEGGHEELKALERATGNPNIWVVFDALEINDASAETLFDRLGWIRQTTGFAFLLRCAA